MAVKSFYYLLFLLLHLGLKRPVSAPKGHIRITCCCVYAVSLGSLGFMLLSIIIYYT